MIRMRKGIVIDYVLLVIVFVSFITAGVSGFFLILLRFSNVSRYIIDTLFLTFAVSALLSPMCFTLFAIRRANRDNCETQSSSVQKYIDASSVNTKSRVELIKLKERG